MKTFTVLVMVILGSIASVGYAGSPSGRPPAKTKVSSYAPRTHSKSHVYGSPIASPVVGRSHASHRARAPASSSHGKAKAKHRAK
jgi:hypothetical protein